MAAMLGGPLLAAGCRSAPSVAPPFVRPVYDPDTGRLVRLDLDANHNGTFEVRTYMDGNRPVRAEVDANEDGLVDRWEYYDPEGRLVRVGTSSTRDSREDTWMVPDAAGRPALIERASAGDGLARRERFENGLLVAVEEDTDGDGRVDKWEHYQDGVLVRLEIDLEGRGRPDRRLLYDLSGTLVRVEVDPDGDGTFVAAPTGAAVRPEGS